MPGNIHSLPPSVIAQWPKPNYTDPNGRFWLPILSCTLLGFSTVLVTTRLYLRARKQAGVFGLDDFFISVGWVISIGLSTSGVIAGKWNGFALHTWDVNPNQFVGAALNGFVCQVLFLSSTCATKASVLLFYRRMAKDTYGRKWLYATWGALGFTAAYFVGVLVAYCNICTPLDAYWLSYELSYHKSFKCVNGNVLTLLVGVLSVVSDVYAVLLPCIWLHLYNLSATRRQRIGLDIIFALGINVAGCGIARTYYLWRENHTYDTSWNGFDVFVWTLLECHLGIIFACAPSLRAFIRLYLAEPFRNTYRSTRRSKSRISTRRLMKNAGEITADLERGESEYTSGESEFTKPSPDTVSAPSRCWSMRSRSSETVAEIQDLEDYEAFLLMQLHRYRDMRIS